MKRPVDGAVTFAELDELLNRAPVLGAVHPLVPVCLAADTQIVTDSHTFVAQLDDRSVVSTKRTLILDHSRELAKRLPSVVSLRHPPVDAINRNMKYSLDYMREHLLTNHKVPNAIEDDVVRNQYDMVALLLVDGLGYGDVLDWNVDVQPCFIDGPSVTFHVSKSSGQLLRSVGFPAIIGEPSIMHRLYHLGYHNALGYTYWETSHNVVAEYMFRGISNNAVVNFEAILMHLEEEPLVKNSYLQIVRQGLDGLAHSKRELHEREIQSATEAIWHDVERLTAVLRRKSQSGVLYIVSDHGILWKNEHDWEVHNQRGSRSRYSPQRPEEHLLDLSARILCDDVPFYLLMYPYLGTSIRKNDSGTHGGLSYQESIVPFIKVRI